MALKLDTGNAADLGLVRTRPLSGRESKVDIGSFGKPYAGGGSFADFLASLPGILQAAELDFLAGKIAEAHLGGRAVSLALGAHNIKVGLGPLYAYLMERGMITSVAFNGAGIIHDFEIALAGRSSEDVAAEISDGSFGMARETAEWLNETVKKGYARGLGIGRAVGEAIWEEGLPHRDKSILAAAYRSGVVATVHVAVGCDIIHMHPSYDAEATGGATHLDFRRFCAVVGELEGGVYLNVGSAVILPEVFLKALTVARNLGREVKRFTAANMDFIRHYRTGMNVVGRPTADGGRGVNLTGPHEILVPLLFAAVLEKLGPEGRR